MAEIKHNSFVCTLTPEQSDALRELLNERGWDLTEHPYAHYKAVKGKTNVVSYCSGKLTAQGGEVRDFVEFLLEPEILKEVVLGTEVEEENETPPDFTSHIGVDESGKGDFFGPLVVAAVHIDETSGPALAKLHARDSKLIKSDAEIARIAEGIRHAVHGNFAVLTLKNPTYNDLYDRIGNLNRLLAWGHARVIENVLEKVPACPRALSDKFGAEHLIKNALMERGRRIVMEQRTKGESDLAVAAASILARDRFVQVMKQLSAEAGCTLPKGASAAVKEAAAKLLAARGADAMRGFCKTHFKTYSELINRGENSSCPEP